MDGFRYALPSTLDEALALMAEPGAMALAGGQTLIPRVMAGMAAPKVLVNLGGLSGLKLIQTMENELAIGAMVSLTEVIRSSTLRKGCPLLAQAAEKTATPSVRNRGTLVGNLAWADPASQLPAAVLAVDGVFRLERAGGFRLVAAEAFFSAPNRTTLAEGEVVTHLHIKPFAERTGSAMADVAPRRNSRALATAAAVVTLDAAGYVERARLAVSGCGDAPRRCSMVEAALIGASLVDAPEAAAAALRVHPPPPGEGVLDAAYAIAVLPVLLRDAVRDACTASMELTI